MRLAEDCLPPLSNIIRHVVKSVFVRERADSLKTTNVDEILRALRALDYVHALIHGNDPSKDEDAIVLTLHFQVHSVLRDAQNRGCDLKPFVTLKDDCSPRLEYCVTLALEGLDVIERLGD